MGGIVAVANSCRCCGAGDLASVFDMGMMPLSDGFADSADGVDPVYPLEVVMCRACGLAQLRHTVAPEVLFGDSYPYFSSYTGTVVDNAQANVEDAIARFRPRSDALIVELASNDGYLLKHAAARGYRTLGIDPALGPVEAARQAGIETIHDFFSERLGAELAASGRKADLVFANNVLAHVADTGGFVRGIAHILQPGGAAIIEAPYLRDLIERNEFDTIYHEHLCYFSVTVLQELFRRQGLALNDVRRIPIHGGSIRLFVQHRPAPSDRLRALLAEEAELGLTNPAAFRTFAGRVDAMGARLRNLLEDLKQGGARIAGYAAAAKGSMLLNRFGIDGSLLDWVADTNPHKQGLFVPTVKLPIVDPVRVDSDRPDYLLILAWNHKDEIIQQQARFAAAGGKFILPVPEPMIVGAL